MNKINIKLTTIRSFFINSFLKYANSSLQNTPYQLAFKNILLIWSDRKHTRTGVKRKNIGQQTSQSSACTLYKSDNIHGCLHLHENSLFQHKHQWMPMTSTICSTPFFAYVMSIFSYFLGCDISKTDLHAPNLPARWQIGCNRKVKLLVSELFRGWKLCSKRS